MPLTDEKTDGPHRSESEVRRRTGYPRKGKDPVSSYDGSTPVSSSHVSLGLVSDPDPGFGTRDKVSVILDPVRKRGGHTVKGVNMFSVNLTLSRRM